MYYVSMKEGSFSTIYEKTTTGYLGAATIIVFSIILSCSKSDSFQLFNYEFKKESLLFVMIVFTLIVMLVSEYFGKKCYIESSYFKLKKSRVCKTSLRLIISTLYRFNALLIIFYLLLFTINNHYYFSDDSFHITKIFFTYFFIGYLFLGIPYIFFTLKFNGAIKYNFGDYAINLILLFKGIIYFCYGYFLKKSKYISVSKRILLSKRIRKVILTYVIIFFFLTLMVKFLGSEFTQFEQAFNSVMTLSKSATFFDKYYAWYLMLYHLLFVVDVSLAIIGYTVASRWLDNRTRSVDTTIGGWIVAIMCYPPMNSGFTEQFISYNRPKTHAIITSEIGRIILMALILLFVGIYVWATIALSFKFSNLTNRGIVTTGPYSIVRHPAYIAKNLSWWLDNTFVLSNLWAALALLAWNIIYILRALTEERHLNKDPKYQDYCKKVKYRFIPGLV